MIPDLKKIFECNPVNPTNCSSPIPRASGAPNITSLADVLSGLFNIVFYVAMFLAFYFLVWGAFVYIMASGKKDDLAKARARITWALIGLAVTLLAFFIAKYAAFIFPARGGAPF